MRFILSSLYAAAATVVVEDATAQLQMRKVHLDEDAGIEYHAAHMAALEKTASQIHAELEIAKSQQLPSQIPPVFLPQPDFSGVVVMPREVKDSYPQEFTASIPISDNGVQFEEFAGTDYAKFPLDHHYKNVIATRKMHHRCVTEAPDCDPVESVEHGELRWIADSGSSLQAIPGTVIGFAERFHVLQHDNPPWVQTEFAHTAETPTAKDSNHQVGQRTQGVMDYLSTSGMFKVFPEASQDLYVLQDIIETVTQYSDVNETVLNGAKDYITGTTKTVVDSKPTGTQPVSIPTSCIHIMGYNGVKIEGSNAHIPLNTYLMIMRMQVVFSPSYEASMAIGRGFFTHDADTDSLVFHQGASSFSYFPITRSGYDLDPPAPTSTWAPKLLVSSAAEDGLFSRLGEKGPLLPDIRALVHPGLKELMSKVMTGQVATAMAVGRAGYLAYAEQPMSYSWLYHSLKDACPESHYEAMETAAQGIAFPMVEFAQHLGQVLPCGLGFLRGSEDNSNGMDLLETTVWLHFLMEWPREHRLHAVRGREDNQDGWHWKHQQTVAEKMAAAAAA